MTKTYLREIKSKGLFGEIIGLDIFEGNIKEDKEYYKKYQDSKVRYFELKEVKVK